MKSPLNAKLLAIALISVSCIALGEEGHRRQPQFVGVLSGQILDVRVDSERCPNPFQPLRIDVAGSAQTTLGRAQFTQTHCEDNNHTVFNHGVLSVSFDDGTKLLGAYQGSIFVTPTTGIDNKVVISGHYRNTGGTGSLAAAHGTGIYAGTVDVSTFAVVIVLSGTL